MTNQTRTEHETEALICIAQDKTKPLRFRQWAINWLWDIHGERFLGLMAAKSRAMNSDWDLQGLSDKQRSVHISGQVYRVFSNVILKFDLTRGPEFPAYLTKMGDYCLKTEKRKNSRMTEREVRIDFSRESRPNNLSRDPEKSPDRNEEALMDAAINEISSRNTFEKKIFLILANEAIKKAIRDKDNLREFLTTAFNVCNESDKGYTDTEVAERMGKSKVQVGNYRRQVLELLESTGVLAKFRKVLAA